MTYLTIDERAEHIDQQTLRGLLIAPDEIWFPYSVEAIKMLKEGLILAVRNTASVHLHQVAADEEDQHFSLLRIDSVDTRHFVIDQIRQDRSNDPISVEGLLQKHQHEWRRRNVDPEENNLRIVVAVSETGLEMHLPMAAASIRGYDEKIQGSTGTTMLGEVAYLMVREVVQAIVNRDMPSPDHQNNVIVAGSHTLYRSPSLDVLIDTDALFRRHLGIFGFTGAGKSNLLSTLVSRSLSAGSSEYSQGEANVLLFDVNNEFYGLLIDSLINTDSHIVFLDDEIGSAMSGFLDGDYSLLDAAAEEFLKTSTLSSAMNRVIRSEEGRNQLTLITKVLLSAGRFKKFHQTSDVLALGAILREVLSFGESLTSKIRGTGQTKKREAFGALLTELSTIEVDINRNVTGEDFAKIVGILELALEYCRSDDDGDDNPVATLLKDHVPKGGRDHLYRELATPIEKLQQFVVTKYQSFQSPIKPSGHTIDLSGLFGALHDNKRTLMLFVGAENSLRVFSQVLGMSIYDFRRRRGVVDPATLFIFDEADIFIPGQAASSTDEEKDAIKASKKIATTLSRRGRKYGLGLGIATQRIAHLDTSILAQLGTYFVGRLPRLYDRQAITAGFGIDKDSLQSGIRGVGDWVVLSHTAVGDKGAPLPVHFENADDRVINFVANFDLSKYVNLSELMKRFDYLRDLNEQRDSLAAEVRDWEFLP